MVRKIMAASAAKARIATTALAVGVGSLVAAPSAFAGGTVTTQSGLAVPSVKMVTPPGAGDFEMILGYLLWIGAAACLGGVFIYVIKAVSAHSFGRSAMEHNGALGACLAGALVLGVAGSALNGLL
jgi:hypothetical protein